MSTTVTKDSTPDPGEGTPKGKGGTMANIVSSVKRKIGQALSPESKTKEKEVSGQITNIAWPEHKKHITGKGQNDSNALQVSPPSNCP